MWHEVFVEGDGCALGGGVAPPMSSCDSAEEGELKGLVGVNLRVEMPRCLDSVG